jgi:hypothetical protein
MACTPFRRRELGVYEPEVGHGETEVTRKFKLEAVRLIEERGVSYVQASRDLGVHTSPFSSNGPFRLATFRWPLTRAVVQTVSYCRSMAW